MLRQVNLWGEVVDKVKIAIERLQHFEPPEGYYVAFSGGKDSVVIYDLAVKAGVKFDAHYNLTTVDPPELVQFIREQFPEVERHRPKKTMWQLIIENGGPPTQIMRYCCRWLKEGGGAGRRVVTGVRWAESNRRKNRRMVENCMTDNTKTFVNPIIDWEDEDVWQYINTNRLRYCVLYDEGFERLGCVMCPCGRTKRMLRDAQRWPKIRDQYLRTFARMIEVRKQKGKPMVWENPEDVMHWWIHQPTKGAPDQTVLFE